jgi:hypothetical protein
MQTEKRGVSQDMIATATARKKGAVVQKYVENCMLLEVCYTQEGITEKVLRTFL